jgi:hypothetical protein
VPGSVNSSARPGHGPPLAWRGMMSGARSTSAATSSSVIPPAAVA